MWARFSFRASSLGRRGAQFIQTPRGISVSTTGCQLVYGDDTDFFDGKYLTKAHPDDLVEFYQAEGLLRVSRCRIRPFDNSAHCHGGAKRSIGPK